MCISPLNSKLNSNYHLLVLLGTHLILHISRIRVKGRIIISYRSLCLKGAILRSPVWIWNRFSRPSSNSIHFFTRVHRLNSIAVKHVRNVMAHAQKPDFVFQRNRWVHINWGEASVQSTIGVMRISGSNGSNAGYIMFWDRVQDYWLPTPHASFPFTSPTARHRCAIRFQLGSTCRSNQDQAMCKVTNGATPHSETTTTTQQHSRTEVTYLNFQTIWFHNLLSCYPMIFSDIIYVREKDRQDAPLSH